MSSPLFISLSRKLSPNWVEAFPNAELEVDLPKQFDRFSDSTIFLDFSGLDEPQKEQWLKASTATNRKVVVLSLTPNNEEALSVIQQGAVGYGHSLSTGSQLREMNLVVKHDGLWVGNQLLKKILSSLGNDPFKTPQKTESSSAKAANQTDELLGKLSNREKAVALEVARGASNQEISVILTIKERTVKAHITSIFSKLNVRNRVELALLLNNVQVSNDVMDIPSKEHTL